MSEAAANPVQLPRWIITTKLSGPRLPEWCVERKRALEKLDGALGCRLGIIHGPPGYGKTTLLSQWRGRNLEAGIATAWLSLDEDDREPGVFLAYLAASLRTAGIPVEDFANVLSDGFTGITPGSVLGALINDLGRLQNHAVMILDDYHRVQGHGIGALLDRLTRHMPQRCHLVIAGREKTDLKLAGLSAYGHMVALNADDLRFSAGETRALFRESRKKHISGDNAELLAQRTEGWVLALQLAGLYFEKERISPDIIQGFSGRTAQIADYLAEQVMLGLSGDVRSFLMETSILERFSGDLADAIRGRSDGWRMIAKLEQRNLFLVCLDSERRWYRYHHLFAEFLRERLKRLDADRVSSLHRSAAEWFVQRERLAEGVRHALQAGDYTYCADALEQAGGWKLVLRGHIAMLRKACEAFPVEVIRAHPRVWLGVILMQAKAGRIAAARRMFGELRNGEGALFATDPELNAECQVIDILISGYEDRPITSGEIGVLERMVTETTSREQLVLAMLTNYLCLVYLDICRFDDAIEAGRQSIRHFRASGNRHAEMTILTHIAQAYLAKGMMNESHSINRSGYGEGLRNAGGDPGDVAPIYGALLGEIAFERNELTLATRLLEESLPFIEQFDGWFDIYASAYLTAASLAHVTRGLEAAMSILDRAEETAVRRRLERLQHIVDIHRVRELTLAGRLAQAGELQAELDTKEPRCEQPLSRRMSWRVNEAGGLCRARLEIRRRNPGRALETLSELYDASVAGRWNRQLIKTLNLMAIARDALGERAGALELLERSLALAAPEGFIRSFLDEGDSMTRLLRFVPGKKPPAPAGALSFVKLLLRSTDRADEIHFSKREREVLKMLAAGFSTKEMARDLELSENTIKYHRKKIYTKLGVGNRSQALAAVRGLSILS